MKQLILLTILLSISLGANIPLGGNLNGIADYSGDAVFVDQIKASRTFGRYDAPWDTTNMTYDANGWPLSDFGVILQLCSPILPETQGIWKIQWKGVGIIRSTLGSAQILNQTYNSTSDLTLAYMQAFNDSENIFLNFEQTQGRLKNLKVVRPGYPLVGHQTFTNAYLNQIRGFKAFRFMDWASTNDNPVVNWSERNTLLTAQYTNGKGVAWEDIINLCNTLQTDGWVNVPAMANDDYIQQMARLFFAQLDPKLSLYVEYSNEVWNWGFSQATYNLQLAQQMANTTQWGPILNYDRVDNPGYWAWRRTALRAKQISDIFRQVYGDCNMNSRVRVVLAGQVVQSITLSEGLDMINKLYGPPNRFFYACAGAPYFNLGNANEDNNLSPDDVLNAMNESINSMVTWGDFYGNMLSCRYYNLEFYAYEGGPDTFGPNSIAAKKSASLDPRIIPLITNYLTIWYSYGMKLFNWFTLGAGGYDSQYGTWSTTNDMNNQNASKIQALRSVLAWNQLPPVTAGFRLPVSNFAAGQDGVSPWRYFDGGASISYLFNSPLVYGGNYSLSLSITNYNPNSTMQVFLNNQPQFILYYQNVTGYGNSYQVNAPYYISMGPGLNVILFSCNMVANRPYEVNNFNIQLVVAFNSPLPTNVTSGCTTSTSSGAEVSESLGIITVPNFILLATVFIICFFFM